MCTLLESKGHVRNLLSGLDPGSPGEEDRRPEPRLLSLDRLHPEPDQAPLSPRVHVPGDPIASCLPRRV